MNKTKQFLWMGLSILLLLGSTTITCADQGDWWKSAKVTDDWWLYDQKGCDCLKPSSDPALLLAPRFLIKEGCHDKYFHLKDKGEVKVTVLEMNCKATNYGGAFIYARSEQECLQAKKILCENR